MRKNSSYVVGYEGNNQCVYGVDHNGRAVYVNPMTLAQAKRYQEKHFTQSGDRKTYMKIYQLVDANAKFASVPVVLEVDGETSDGYHTFNELYDHRCLLWINLCLLNPDKCYLVKEHFEGWFLLGMETAYGQISYHCPNKNLSLVEGKIKEHHPEFDGHTPNNVLVRLEHIARFASVPVVPEVVWPEEETCKKHGKFFNSSMCQICYECILKNKMLARCKAAFDKALGRQL